LKFKINKKHKYLIAGGAVLIFFGLIYRLLPFFQAFESVEAELIIKQRQLEKFRQTVQQGSVFDERIAYLRRVLKNSESGLLNGKTPSLAAVDIQNLLSEIVGTSGVQIKRVRVLKPEKLEKEYYISIPVEFSIIADIRQLKEVLYKIETYTKYLTVKSVLINAGRGGGERFQANVTVAGYMKKE